MLKKKVWILISFLAALSLVMGLWFAPYFAIQSLDWEGNQYIPDSLIRKVLVPYEGCSIFRAWVGGFPRLLKHTFPQLDEVSVRAVFPNKVKISLKEREPWAIFVSDKRKIMVTVDGIVMSRKNDLTGLPGTDSLPVITGVPVECFSGAVVSPNLIQAVKTVVGLVKENIPSGSVQIGLDGVDALGGNFDFRSVVLTMPEGFEVKMGEVEGIEARFKQLHLFLVSFELSPEKPVSYIDMRVEGKVLVKYVDG